MSARLSRVSSFRVKGQRLYTVFTNIDTIHNIRYRPILMLYGVEVGPGPDSALRSSSTSTWYYSSSSECVASDILLERAWMERDIGY